MGRGVTAPPTSHRVTNPHRGPLLAIGGGLLVLCVLALVFYAVATTGPAPAGAGTPGPILPTTSVAAPTVVPTPRPIAVRIPSLGVQSELIETGINPDGTAEVPPAGPDAPASWMDVSPRPGEQGPAVLLGHVDGGGQAGVFNRIGELHGGDEILVDRDGAPPARFEVYQVQSVPKAAFPTGDVYRDTPGAELVLITCGGSFDRSTGHYRDNVVVRARLATAVPSA